ncbi:PPK2 family polyphosphate kinase [Propioniciclava soli]|uniref:Polyphosphate kinase 2 family protein n=1 Tax=Propioniciclava soli TaxID=2775081 RepID=A0ABZ3C5F3_9ACTN|nr:PPK2 family polyphosphate kinase [Propioniciclava soli]
MGKDELNTPNPWQADPRDLLRAGPDFDLARFDRGGKPGFDGGKAEGKAFMADRAGLLSELQERLYAEGRAGGTRSVLCVVQGLDTAGKGGVARHVMSLVDPQGVALRSFGPPTEEERKHHYLWRIKKALPPAGRIGVFDRSHYEDVLVVRVDDLVPQKEWEPRYDEINAFEADLVESGTIVLKFALMVSHDEQGVRLMERLDRPDKRWKFSENDLTTRAKWDDYQAAYADVFARTSTEHAPWYVIPANRKWYSRTAIVSILTQTLIEMDLGWPEPEWDVFDLRARLAEQMSVDALETSLAETEDNVRTAIAENAATDKLAARTAKNDGSDTALAEQAAVKAQVDADKASYLAELARTRDQKAELLEAARSRTA